jgi:hypothetical protein
MRPPHKREGRRATTPFPTLPSTNIGDIGGPQQNNNPASGAPSIYVLRPAVGELVRQALRVCGGEARA